MAGLVYVNNQKFDKPGDTVDEESEMKFRGKGLRYVSRGGLIAGKRLWKAFILYCRI